MVTQIVFNVKCDNRRVGEKPVVSNNADPLVGSICPLCGKGTVLKGKTAYGCSEWKSGCTYRLNF